MDTFQLDTYLNVLGKLDSIKLGGEEIINEFSFDDYNLWYGKDLLNAGHGYLLSAKIMDKKINLNGIYVGDDIQKTNNTFKISANQKDSIKIISKNDDVMLLIFKNKKIHTINLWRPI